ncbi:MAG: agmatinase [Burkholderiaceae bacterium]|jgi:agmatinase
MTSFAFLSDSSFLKCGRADPADSQTPARPYGLAGLAWDGSTTNRSGARMGPRAIRAASHMLCDGIHPHFNTEPASQLDDLGDLPLPNTSLQAMREGMATLLPSLLQARHMVWLGGDHSVTLPILRALREQQGQAVGVLHFDAHCDTWTDHFGEPSGHGTWVAEAFAEGLVVPSCFTQIGIRSAGERAAREFVSDHGGRIFTARDLRGRENHEQLASALQDIRQRWEAQGRPPMYLSLDIDCLDPAFAPGTGTPEPGGLSTNQVLTFLEELHDLNFVGMDCVEVAPPYDHAELTAYAAAHFVWTYLAGRIKTAT